MKLFLGPCQLFQTIKTQRAIWMEQLRQTAARIFKKPYFPISQGRTGQAILSQPLYGPELKSHWPLRLRELTKYWNSSFNTEISLSQASNYVRCVTSAYCTLPYPLSRVYRQSIGQWRHNRGKIVKRGESKITSTNLGKIDGSSRKNQ